ncbi:PREDICTED: neurotrypsin-like [Amphimedon queenslandica]|uniref:SRCR domain-containing protein n=1 Tax=Amphimedon queenslandica TaxID=400682 RepID=A0AAN0IWR1_AMPQE|nr:PREDICTED: neurotrypsin-like [Amphimedon queenslandica]|eukprot:XP_019848873.1 PREDICTED: neurotrypsin-like [Amphimedon queenslandica]
MSCKKDYLVILQCSFKTDNVPANCNNGRNVWVTCYYTRMWDRTPYTGMVRLVNSSYISQGIVEVYCHGKWGVVCNKTNSESFALTVCKQLGYNLVSSYDYNTTFSSELFPSMQDANCDKKCIKDCASCDENIDSCGHGILNVSCKYEGTASNHGNKIEACSPINLYPGQLAVTALVLILTLYLYFITRVCIRIITMCCRRRRGQPLLEENLNNQDNNRINRCRARCSVICDILCCN